MKIFLTIKDDVSGEVYLETSSDNVDVISDSLYAWNRSVSCEHDINRKLDTCESCDKWDKDSEVNED